MAIGGYLGSGVGLNDLRALGVDPTKWFTTGPEPLTAGTSANVPGLAGLPVYPPGERAVPGKPAIPSPFETQKSAIAGNLANLPDFSDIYGRVGSLAVGGDYPAVQRQEYANIADMLGGTLGPRDLQIGTAMASQRGLGGSPAGNLLSLFETRAQRDARNAAGSQLLTNAMARQPLPLNEWMISPGQEQYWQYLAALRNAAADPWAQFNLASRSAAMGLQQGAASQGRGRGGGGYGGFGGGYSPTPAATALPVGYGARPSTGAESYDPFSFMFNSSDYLFGPEGWEQTSANYGQPPIQSSYNDQFGNFPAGIPIEPDYVAPYMEPLLEDYGDYYG